MQQLTLGIEEEFLVVDVNTGGLVPRAHHLLDLARPTLGEEVEPELNLCQIEVGTPICHTLDEAEAHLARLRTGLRVAGDDVGIAALPIATHPFGLWQQQQVDLENPRYRRMDSVYQMVARQQVICGCHVHVGMPNPDLAIAVMNRSRAWLPALLALSANSPYWQNMDSGFDSYRLQVWQRWPTSGMPPELPNAAAYDELVDELTAMGAIEDATFLYWYVRPSARYPTVEFRVCDVCLDYDDTVTIAGLIRALAWTCADEERLGMPVVTHHREAMDAAVWRAARYGLLGELISPRSLASRPAAEVVAEFVDHVQPGLEAHGDAARIKEGVEAILARGNGAQFQRQARHGDDDGFTVVQAVLERGVPRWAAGSRSSLAPTIEVAPALHKDA